MSPAGRPQILGLSRTELGDLLGPHIDRSFRVDQVWEAMYRRGVTEFERMSSLGKDLRRRLEAEFRIELPRVVDREASSDGTEKLLLELEDGTTVEAVDIPTEKRRTLCISSQAGCALGCRFCVTGYWGGGRDLTAGEIVGQVMAIRGAFSEENERLNIVYMGMGEPLANLTAVKASLEILTETISWRRITVSTAGVIPGIEAMAGWTQRPNLAISLHAPDQERRSRLMPISRTYPLEDLLVSLRAYPLAARRRLTFEYLLIDEFNSSLRDADLLARLLEGFRCKVNLIPVNPDPVLGERMVPPSEASVEQFRQRLADHGLFASVRKRRGGEVAAACGQLRAPSREPRGFRRSNLSF